MAVPAAAVDWSQKLQEEGGGGVLAAGVGCLLQVCGWCAWVVCTMLLFVGNG